MAAYYNDTDPYCAKWLRNLIAAGHIAAGDVDERSIVDVRPDDVRGYEQCHFFAGIGGWSLALRLAGWPDDRPVWTGSCPCQGISSATRGRPRHRDLWPEWRRIIVATRPRAVFGEQVANAEWATSCAESVESVGYKIIGAVLPCWIVGADHARHRFYFKAYTDRKSKPRRAVDAEMAWLPRVATVSEHVPAEDGLPCRVERMRAYGNSICPQTAAAFIMATMPDAGHGQP